MSNMFVIQFNLTFTLQHMHIFVALMHNAHLGLSYFIEGLSMCPCPVLLLQFIEHWACLGHSRSIHIVHCIELSCTIQYRMPMHAMHEACLCTILGLVGPLYKHLHACPSLFHHVLSPV